MSVERDGHVDFSRIGLHHLPRDPLRMIPAGLHEVARVESHVPVAVCIRRGRRRIALHFSASRNGLLQVVFAAVASIHVSLRYGF
jgi:hypothetical protein